MAPLSLPELQSRLRALISDPRTLSAPDDALDGELAALSIRGDGRLSAAERVRIYGRMYFLRLRDALASDLPALRRALGDASFDALVQAYVAAHPSDRPSLRDLGRHLPGFAMAHPALVAPWQAELAQLEWALTCAFDAPDEDVLEAADLASLAPESWPDLEIRPVASLVLLSCTTPVDVVHERLLAGEDVAEPAPDATWLRVWRQDLQVFQRRTAEREMAALRWVHRGASFGELCGWLAEQPTIDPGAEATALLRRWLDDALLVAP
jgi:hypothetical protein